MTNWHWTAIVQQKRAPTVSPLSPLSAAFSASRADTAAATAPQSPTPRSDTALMSAASAGSSHDRPVGSAPGRMILEATSSNCESHGDASAQPPAEHTHTQADREMSDREWRIRQGKVDSPSSEQPSEGVHTR